MGPFGLQAGLDADDGDGEQYTGNHQCCDQGWFEAGIAQYQQAQRYSHGIGRAQPIDAVIHQMARAAQAIEQGCDEDQQRRQAEGGDEMAYFGRDRQSLMLSLVPGARAILIGGEPLEDEILMWWNFVGYSKAEIAEA